MSDTQFTVGQIFVEDYPSEAALFCNKLDNKYFIDEIEPDEEGKRRFQIKEVPAPTAEELASSLRSERDRRLSECDGISPMRWNSMTALQQAAWTQYRLDLLNIPQQSGFPWGGDISAAPWPNKPE